ncbi:hypothetical protein BKA70DRAFT_1450139 [Coprinopsis sp. MPI-PUGE-AT-0042]|nr:hypothetical protein BKA70DRAFT_1450139 [Coprinopsis sp. MPI-PUGE-AT-0042]
MIITKPFMVVACAFQYLALAAPLPFLTSQGDINRRSSPVQAYDFDNPSHALHEAASSIRVEMGVRRDKPSF